MARTRLNTADANMSRAMLRAAASINSVGLLMLQSAAWKHDLTAIEDLCMDLLLDIRAYKRNEAAREARAAVQQSAPA